MRRFYSKDSTVVRTIDLANLHGERERVICCFCGGVALMDGRGCPLFGLGFVWRVALRRPISCLDLIVYLYLLHLAVGAIFRAREN